MVRLDVENIKSHIVLQSNKSLMLDKRKEESDQIKSYNKNHIKH